MARFLTLLLMMTFTERIQTLSDERQFILVFDAGSTGTRLNVFEFRVEPNHSTGLQLVSLKVKNTSTGLSYHARTPGRLRDVMSPLMDYAKVNVPARYHENTTAIVRATAGLRAVSDTHRRGIVRVVAEVLRKSNFHVPEPDSRAVRVISGQEEAEYGWVAVNYLLDAFDQSSGDTYGMLDLGGGSTQITFVPQEDDPSDLYRYVFRTMRGRTYALHEHSYLGLGLSQAKLYMFGQGEEQLPLYVSPCLSPDITLEYNFGEVFINVTGDPNVTDGAERLRRCSEAARVPLRKVPVHQPPGIKVARFVAVSSFYYTASMLRAQGFLNRAIPGNVTIDDLAAAATRVCERPPTSGKHEPYLCMTTLYILTLLRDGYRFSGAQSIYITHKINGYSASWPLGLAIHRLTCHDRSGNICLGSSAVQGARASVPAVTVGSIAVVTMLSVLRRL